MNLKYTDMEVIDGLLKRFDTGEYFYENGRIYRTKRNVNNHKSITLNIPEVASLPCTNGYRRVNYKKSSMYEHRLIYAYHYGVDELMKHQCIDHADGDKQNNDIENLRGLSVRENTKQAELQGRFRRTFGKINGRTTVSDEDVREIRRLGSEGINQYEIASLFNVSQGYISNVINNKVRTQCGIEVLK